MQKVYELILKAANSNASVCIFGESGTGKELVARAVHELSRQAAKGICDSQLRGHSGRSSGERVLRHKKGAFTGAYADKAGTWTLPTAAVCSWMKSGN